MPSPQPYRPLLDQGTLVHHILLGFLHLGDGHLRLVLHGHGTSQIPTYSYRLLHQMDRDRAISRHHNIKGPAVPMETPHMVARRYKFKVQPRDFREEDLVWRKTGEARKKKEDNKFTANSEANLGSKKCSTMMPTN
ncbi:hypothetical protein CR513_39177, partial [Mucuna pruriens]